MDLDFGPTEAPNQPPTNPPPVANQPVNPISSGAAPQAAKPAGSQITFGPSGGSTSNTTTSQPQGSQAGAWTPPPAAPVAPQKGGRSKFLIIGILIILAGLGYLAYSLLGAKSSSTGVATTPTTPTATSTLDTGVNATTSTVTPITPTTPAATTTTGTTASTTATSTTPTTPATTSSTTGAASETMQTRDAIRKKDLATIQTYLESYLTDKGSYPIAKTTARLNDNTATVVTALVPKYTAALPRDPKDPEFFYGYKSVDGKTYTLSARLENTADTEGKTEGTVFLYTLSK